MKIGGGPLQRRKGLFFVFEGADGAGTTTQCRLLAEALAARGHKIITTREPGGTSIGERIRNLVLDNQYREMSENTELLLYAAARAQHVAQTIRPALMAGDLVICDRFTASTVAYQVCARGIDRGITETLNEFVVGECVPDHTFYLNVSLAESCRRRVERNQPVDRMEEEGNVFHGKVISGFEKIATNDSRPKSILDASEDKEQLAARVLSDVRKRWAHL